MRWLRGAVVGGVKTVEQLGVVALGRWGERPGAGEWIYGALSNLSSREASAASVPSTR